MILKEFITSIYEDITKLVHVININYIVKNFSDKSNDSFL